MASRASESGKLKPHIAVVGAGVIGLSTAIRLLQILPSATVTLLAERFGSETTTAGAAGLWEPYKLSDTPADLIKRWGAETLAFYQSLVLSADAASAGVFEVTGHQFWSEPHEDPSWADIVPRFSRLSPAELEHYDRIGSGRIKDGWTFSTIICEGSRHLSWLHRRAEQLGIRIQQQHIESLEELADYDLVMNCSGLGAAELFGDSSMYPIRGHVVRVRAPWIKGVYFMDEETYIIPNTDDVVLGGTGDVGAWDTTPDPRTRDAILQRCSRLMPSLAKAEFVSEWVGLRPGRPSVRLELGSVPIANRKAALPVVHNYGHGGAGLTLGWGCAGHAAELAVETLHSKAVPESRL